VLDQFGNAERGDQNLICIIGDIALEPGRVICAPNRTIDFAKLFGARCGIFYRVPRCGGMEKSFDAVPSPEIIPDRRPRESAVAAAVGGQARAAARSVRPVHSSFVPQRVFGERAWSIGCASDRSRKDRRCHHDARGVPTQIKVASPKRIAFHQDGVVGIFFRTYPRKPNLV